MVIGIIGASFAGLVAGSRLARAGHDVTIMERNESLGGRISSIELDDIILDNGVPHLSAETNTFQTFLAELQQETDLHEWAEEFSFYDGLNLHNEDPNASPLTKYALEGGIGQVNKYLSRWVDVRAQEKAGGLTYIGPDREKKRSWMINLTNINVFECDAVIIATPATEAYGILQTAQDETAARKIIRVIDEVFYDDCISIAATYDREAPEWKGIKCENSALRWIGNESTKRNTAAQTGLVIHSSHKTSKKYERANDDEVTQHILDEASSIIGSWVSEPKSTSLKRWKYFTARNVIDEYFMELEMIDAPLALVGNYFGGRSVEKAYLSGYNLAEYWINKYSNAPVA